MKRTIVFLAILWLALVIEGLVMNMGWWIIIDRCYFGALGMVIWRLYLHRTEKMTGTNQ